ncbi:hypothetical protein RFI_16066, partial [Reticulomyxa filosa]
MMKKKGNSNEDEKNKILSVQMNQLLKQCLDADDSLLFCVGRDLFLTFFNYFTPESLQTAVQVIATNSAKQTLDVVVGGESIDYETSRRHQQFRLVDYDTVFYGDDANYSDDDDDKKMADKERDELKELDQALRHVFRSKKEETHNKGAVQSKKQRTEKRVVHLALSIFEAFRSHFINL